MEKKKKVKETKRTLVIPFSLTWPKKGESIKPVVNTTTVSNTGILFTCILLSVASGFIDLTFFSGLSKSLFHVSTIPIPAALLYTVISIGLISGKFWCAMRIGAIKELQNRLKNEGYKWWRNINKVKFRWNAAHKFLIGISIITALSLSVNSIGSGVRTIEQTIKNMTADANELIELRNSYKTGVTDKRDAAKDNIAGQRNAQETAAAEVNRYAGRLKKYQEQYFQISDNPDLTDDEKKEQQDGIVTKIVNEIPGTTRRNAIYFNEADLRKSIQNTSSSNEVIDNSALYEEAILFDSQQIEDFIKALEYKDYKDPDGTPLVFTKEDGEPLDIQVVISLLQGSINKWQAPDAGDVGESSKIFTLIATYIKADSTAGGMGVSEWMLLILIAIVGIVQEFLIALFTPKTTIDRKLLYNYDAYFGEDFNIDLFLLKTYKDYEKKGVISQRDYEIKARKCVELMENTIEDDILRYSKKQKPRKDETEELSEKLTELKAYYEKKLEDERAFTKYVRGLEEAKTSSNEKEIKEVLQTVSATNSGPRTAFADDYAQAPKETLKTESIQNKVDLPPKVEETPISERVKEIKESAEKANQVAQDFEAATKPIIKEGYSDAVDKAVNEIEELLKD